MPGGPEPAIRGELGSTISLIPARRFSDELDEVYLRSPEHVYAKSHDRVVTVRDLRQMSLNLSKQLTEAGIGEGARVATALQNSIDYVALVFALDRVGAVWVPVNLRVKAPSLEYLIADASVDYVVADSPANSEIAIAIDHRGVLAVAPLLGLRNEHIRLVRLRPGASRPSLTASTTAVIYTSGTSGPPKGVQLTPSMFYAATTGCVYATDPQEGDIYFLWEPLCHIGGAEVLLAPLVAGVSLYVTQRFSASTFWEEMRRSGSTHVHYLGGILDILLATDRHSRRPVDGIRWRIAWGGGASQSVWQRAEAKFGVEIRECYGMTEASSIVTVNREGSGSGIGRALPWFDTRLERQNGRLTDGEGELLVLAKRPGLITPGYVGRDAVTDSEVWRTGDMVQESSDGSLHYRGRISDSFRVRGENVSAWEVESVINSHKGVERCAVTRSSADVGEEEMVLHIVPTSEWVGWRELCTWASASLADFQIPRFLRLTDTLPMTPSDRVAKEEIAYAHAELIDRAQRLENC